MNKQKGNTFKRIFKITLITILVTVIGFTTLTMAMYFFSGDMIYYKTYTPKVENIVKNTVVTGRVIPRKEVQIKPQIPGIIDQIYFKPGDMVKKGQVIAKLKVIPEMLALNEAEARLKIAELNHKNIQLNFERHENLYKKKLISKSEFEQEELNLNTAKTQLEEAENYLQLVKEGIFSKSGKETNTLIKATIDGKILEIPVKVGHSVIQTNAFNDGTTIAVVADMSDMIFNGSVLEAEVNKLTIDMPLELTVAALENQKFDAVLEYVAPKGFEDFGSVKFEIKAKIILKEDRQIRAGLSANADIVLDKKENVLVINEKLVKFEDKKPYVEILVNEDYQEYKRQYVELGLSNGIEVEIISGIELTDKIKGEKLY